MILYINTANAALSISVLTLYRILTLILSYKVGFPYFCHYVCTWYAILSSEVIAAIKSTTS